MKSIGVVPLAIALLAVPASAATPRAVVVGVGDYADPLLTDLAGPPLDAVEMHAVLIERLGFDPRDVYLLVDADATRDAILLAMHRAIGASRPGDPFVFYFSGHGARVFDASGDEPDGWDEGLVPHDSGRGSRPNRDLLDDELSTMLTRLVDVGAHPTVILDSCHAGTGARDPDGVRAAPDDDRPDARLLMRPTPGAGAVGGKGIALDDVPAGWTLIGAAREDQLAYEKPIGPNGARRGLLTWHLTRALRAARPDATWRDVMEQVAAAVTQRDARQQPQLEGAGADRSIFGRPVPPAPPYVLAHPAGAGHARLVVGAAHAVAVGAVFAIHPPGARAFETGGVEARVVRIDAVDAIAEIPSGASIASASRAVMRSPGRATTAVPIYLEPTAEALAGRIEAVPGVVRALDPQRARMRVHKAPDGWSLSGADGMTLDDGNDAAVYGMYDSSERLFDGIEAWARWHAIADLDAPDASTLAVDFAVIVEGVRRPHPVRLTTGDRFEIVVSNGGSRDVYLTILALGDDGTISVLYPLPGARAYVQAFGEWRQAAEAAVPAGRAHAVDRLKLVVTTRPTDLRFLQQGARHTADLSDPLAALFAHAAGGATPRSASASPGEWAARTLTITTARAPATAP